MAIKKIRPGYITGAFILLFFVILTFFNWPLIDHVDRFLYRAGSGLISENGSFKNEDLVIIRLDKKGFDKQSFTQACLKLIDSLSEGGARVIAFTSLSKTNEPIQTIDAVRAFTGEVKGYPYEKSPPGSGIFYLNHLTGLKKSL